MNLTSVKEMIEDMGTSLKPDEDWLPHLILENATLPDGKIGNIILAMVGFLHEKDGVAGKDIAAEAIALIISQSKPDTACFVCTAWKGGALSSEEMEEGNYPLPSQDPKRTEIVLCLCVGRKGINDGETTMFGEIKRSKGPPKISNWITMDEEGESQGRFADAMRKGFAMIEV